jgi:hypothetical protein
MKNSYMRRRGFATVLCFLFVIGAHTGYADTIYKEDGSITKGLVVEEHHDRVVFSTYEGEKTVFKETIDEIFFDELEQNYYYIATRFLNEHDFERAEKFYVKAREANPSYRMPHDGLSRLSDVRLKEVRSWSPESPLRTLKEQLGISLSRKDDLCRIDVIFGKSKEVQLGDAISSVWDESTKFMTEQQAAERLIGIPETSVKTTIQRTVRFRSRSTPWYMRVMGMQKKHVLPLQMAWEGLTAGHVIPGTLAAQVGLQRGDRIVAVDGRSTRYMPLKEARALIHNSAQEEVELTIERDIVLTRRGG